MRAYVFARVAGAVVLGVVGWQIGQLIGELVNRQVSFPGASLVR